MQKLLVKLKNTPTDASQVCSSVNSQLNKEETLSVENKVLANNNFDVNLPAKAEALQHKAGGLLGEGVSPSFIFKNIRRFYYGSFVYRRVAIPPLPKGRGILAAIG